MTTDKNLQILAAARDAWLAAAQFRIRRDRYKRYTYGDQWSDILLDRKGRPAVESDLIKRSGKKPLTNNLIRQTVKTVIGRYRSSCVEQNVYDSSRPGKEYIDDNALFELDCRMLEEFLISGCAIQRIARQPRHGVSRLCIDNVDPRAFFVNAFRDPRGADIDLIGMTHDLSFAEIVSRFADSDRKKAARLARIFSLSPADNLFRSNSLIGEADSSFDDFLTPAAGRCRVIEVWTLDCRNSLLCHDTAEATAFRTANSSRNRASISKINAARSKRHIAPLRSRQSLDFVWRCRWFAPDGSLLDAYDSPFAHRSHPFAVKFYPLTDGEIHSFVEDIIDQQRCINRMTVLIDHIIGASAKGVLLFPCDQKPKNIEWDEIASTWAQSNGIIPITGNAPHMPQQIMTSTKDHGAYQLLALQMKLFENISGVSDFIAGRDIPSSTGNALFQSRMQNSAIALADLIDSFASFRRQRDKKAENI